MEPHSKDVSAPVPPSSTHRRTPSASSILSKMGFMRSPAEAEKTTTADAGAETDMSSLPTTSSSAMSSVVQQQQQQQQKTRRRRGSLRKVALLGRGAQREKRDMSPLVVDADSEGGSQNTIQSGGVRDALGLNVEDATPRPSADGFAGRVSSILRSSTSTAQYTRTDRDSQPSYTSTTDEEDTLQLPPSAAPPRPGLAPSSGSESYFSGGHVASQTRRPGFQQAKSPLSYSGLPTTPGGPAPDSDWDYTETEWWGWVVLTVTWFVFVVGMGSCLDIWSWAWDVGKTPYAPPELEDDPTLPIVGYYPALLILSCVMAWVWVVVAWVGMKYFRHAKISGD